MKKPFKNPFRHHRAKNRNKPRGYSPTQIICVSFVIVIALGTLLLSLPIASRYGRMRVIDAMFTATSATCVTGLVVRDTWTQFTVFGQAVILVLIQVGGLGLVTLLRLSRAAAVELGRGRRCRARRIDHRCTCRWRDRPARLLLVP